MNSFGSRVLSFFVVFGGIAGIGALTSTSAHSQGGGVKNVVWLQGATPGTQQSGHVNVSGTVRAGSFSGGGAAITNLVANNITFGTLPDARLSVGGDLTGPLSNATVARLQGRPVSSTAPLAGDVLTWGGASWIPGPQGISLPYNGSTGTTNPTTFKILNTNPLGAQTILHSEGWSAQAVAIKGIGNTGVFGSTNSGRAFEGEVTGTAGGYGIYLNHNAPTGQMIYGRAMNGANGIDLILDGPGADGISVNCLATTGSSWAISGSASGPDSYGVRGSASGAGAGTGTGVFGFSAKDSGFGVSASVSGASGYGLHSNATGATTRGLNVRTSHTSGASYAAYLENASSAGTGLYSHMTSQTGTYSNQYYISASPNATGVTSFLNAFSSGSGKTFKGISNVTGSTILEGILQPSSSGSGYGVDISAQQISSGAGFRINNSFAGNGGFNGVDVTHKSWDGNGVKVSVESPDGWAINAENTGFEGRGLSIKAWNRAILAESTNTVANSLNTIHSISHNNEGSAVYGFADNDVGGSFIPRGIYGEVTGRSGRAVTGVSNHGTGDTYGGRFSNHSTAGTGVFGQSTTNTGANIGVYGLNDSNAGYAIRGETTHMGAGASPIAIYGQNFNTAFNSYAMFGNGNIGGSLKSFVIDHPLDPQNAILRHYCTEGPEPLNVFKGSVRTDAKGYATVDLPDYFEEANRDGAVSLTVVDDGDSEDFVMAKVIRGGIQNNRFTIRTSAGNTKVFWRVEAVRNDAYVRLAQPKSEYPKPENWKGKYLNPQAFGESAERGIHFRAKSAPDVSYYGQTSHNKRK